MHMLTLLTSTSSNVDVSWIDTIADGIVDIFASGIFAQWPVNAFITCALIGAVVGLVKTFKH